MTELRHDAVSDRLVIIAPGRGARPHTLFALEPESERGAAACPFCPGNEGMTPPEIARSPSGEPGGAGADRAGGAGWRIRVFPNLYPIADAHDVIVLSPDHDRS